MAVAVWKNVFSPEELDAVEAMGDALMPMRAELGDRKDIPKDLRVTRVAWMRRNAENEWLYARLEEVVLQLNQQFYGFDLYGLIESFQYTIYDDKEGGHYNWHIDLPGPEVAFRKISLSLQLTDPTRYKGCDLELQAGDGFCIAERARGTLIAFPSFVLHRVSPIESGVRKSLVIWAAGPPFR